MTVRAAPPQAIIEEAEFRRSKASFYYFFTNHWKVQIPKKGPRKPEDRQFQKDVSDLLDGPDADQLRLVALKARQIGFTTVVAAFATWSCLFGEDVPWLFVSRGETEAKKNLARAAYGYKRLPQWMKDRLPRLEAESTERLKWSNESRIDSIPASASSGRGDSVYGVLFDEAAHMENPEELFGSLDPLCYGPMLVFSSANGMGNWFHRQWLEASRPDSEWQGIFCSWREVPGRDEKWYERTKRRYRGSLWLFYQEYPSTPEEAFAKTGQRAIGADLIDDDTQRLPFWRFLWVGDRFDTENPLSSESDPEDLELHVWYKPTIERDEQRRVIRKPNYVLFADTAEGIGGGDFNTIAVWDVHTETVVATVRTLYPIEEMAPVYAWIGYWYHTALIMVERNNTGLVPIVELAKTIRYPRLYRMEQIGQIIKGDRTPRYGWHTNKATKPKMVLDFLRALRSDNPPTVHCPHWHREVTTFVKDGRGGYAAGGDNHDDMVIAVIGGWQGVQDVGDYPIVWYDDEPGPPTWADIIEISAFEEAPTDSGSLRIQGGSSRPEKVKRSFTLAR